MERGKEKE